MSFAWGRDDGWRHHGGYRERGYIDHVIPPPFYLSTPRYYYVPLRRDYDHPRHYYGRHYGFRQPVVVPQQYGYRPHY